MTDHFQMQPEGTLMGGHTEFVELKLGDCSRRNLNSYSTYFKKKKELPIDINFISISLHLA